MNRMRLLLPAVAVLSLGVLGMLARPGSTAPVRPAATLAVGYVDMEDVAAKSAVGQQTKREAEALRTRLQDQLEKRSQLRFLTAEQRQELARLEEKKTPSDSDKARIAELKGISTKFESELRELSQKTSPTDADRTRIEELIRRDREAKEQLFGERDAAQKELEEKGLQLMNALQDKIMKAVEETARERGLAMVVHKEARLFGGEDITEAVISRLKK